MAINIDPRLVQIGIDNLPVLIALGKSLFAKSNPAAPAPTDEEVIAAFQQALESSLAKDREILASHPPETK